MHKRSKHPAEFHAQKIAEIATDTSKARLSKQEVQRLAVAEAGIRFSIFPAVNMNQLLLNVFPGRSLESIKEKRRAADYEALVEAEIAKLTNDIVNEEAEAHSRSKIPSLPEADTVVEEAITEAHEELNTLDDTIVYHWAYDHLKELNGDSSDFPN